ncbi:hypothetical protein FGRMN_5190 [Fusarium graminum]|nr:hypothetical protein FGRMN_5190 [Fusarium graminum]
MADTYSRRYDRAGGPLSTGTGSTLSSNRYSGRRSGQIPEPTFSPTGLLGNRYDFLKQETEARSREAEQQAPQSPFTGGLLQSLVDFEVEERLARTRSHRASYDSIGNNGRFARAASVTSATSYRSQPPSRDFTTPKRTPSVASVRTDSIYCAQTGVTPPPLLDMSSTLPQRRPSWRDSHSHSGGRSPFDQQLRVLPEHLVPQWNPPSPPPLSRSQSAAVRSTNRGSKALEQQASSTTAPFRPTTWDEAASRSNNEWSIEDFQMYGPQIIAEQSNPPSGEAEERALGYYHNHGILADTGIRWNNLDQSIDDLDRLYTPMIGFYGYSLGYRSRGGHWAGFRYRLETEEVEFSPLSWFEVQPYVESHKLSFFRSNVGNTYPPKFIAKLWIIRPGDSEPETQHHYCGIPVEEPTEGDPIWVEQLATTCKMVRDTFVREPTKSTRYWLEMESC